MHHSLRQRSVRGPERCIVDLGSRMETPVPAPIQVPSHVFDVAFHPTTPVLLASCHVTGRVLLWKLDEASNAFQREATLKHHKQSCRALRFFEDGTKLVTASADRTCAVVNTDGSVIWRTHADTEGAHEESVNALHILNETTIASGDDDGCIKVWDIRASGDAPAITFHEYDEFVSDITHSAEHHPNYIITTTGDCLGQFDIRMPHLEAMSDPQEGDLLCCRIVRNGSKVLCGTGHDGSMSLFSWGNFGDLDDRLVGHGVSVDCIVPFPTPWDDCASAEVVVTGAGDGLIRLVSLFPNKIIGTLGTHADEESSIDVLALNPSASLLVSGSHDNMLRFHSTAHVHTMVQEFFKTGGRREVVAAPTDFFSDL